jgi:4-hydroxybenzoate polyprenyltransferase
MALNFLRSLLVLGRVSNLPTVWSNCVAGWLLGGDTNYRQLGFVLAGATLLYVGGMFLNDAFDAEFDRAYRTERPIPVGAISLRTVWAFGVTWLLLGAGCLFWVSPGTGMIGVVLLLCIVLYDWLHKRVSFGPFIMGACRTLVYIVAASSGAQGVTGWAIWSGLVLGLYVVGLSYLARGESRPAVQPAGLLRYWPLLLLLTPVALALLLNAGHHREGALLIGAVFLVWVIKSLRYTLWANEPAVGRTVSGLLAGIVLVDWLAVCYAPKDWGFIFIGLFLAALVFQKFVPAT